MKKIFATLSLSMLPLSLAQAVPAPPGTLFAFQGQETATSQPCFLFITGAQQSGSTVTAMRVQTAFGHGNDRAPELSVYPQRPGIWAGASASGQDQIAISLGNPSDPRSVIQYNLKWWHVNHAHNFQCRSMTPVKR